MTGSTQTNVYSARSARIGSTEAARCAGIQIAVAAMTRRISGLTVKAYGSRTLMPYSSVASSRGEAEREADPHGQEPLAHHEAQHIRARRAERHKRQRRLAHDEHVLSR
jgi:hypothetical protein